MRTPRPTTIDFETLPIRQRPHYPPAPIGVSIKPWGKPARYLAFGHLVGNTCTRAQAVAALVEAYATPDGVLCQNGKFDVDVAEVHLGLAPPAWQRLHDTMFLLFLDDPHQKELGLKPSAERLLGLPPEEQDAVADWLVTNQPVPGVKIGRGRESKHPAGAYLAYAPGALVGKYANGDAVRTEKLFKLLWPKTCGARKMQAAYDRERRLMPILLESERGGVRVDLGRLRVDVALYQGWLVKIDAWVRARVRAPDLNVDSGSQLAAAMIAAGVADASLMGVTKTGLTQTNKAALADGVTDKVLAAVLQYRAQLSTCVGTFLAPWLATAEASGGLIFTTWNQVKAVAGTRTGRLSSTPNFQNMPKEFAALFHHELAGLPLCPWPDLPKLPLCRGYIVPYEEGHLLLGRDYSQQEPRILAHFEGGDLQAQYVANPWIDYHDNAKEHLERVMGRPYQRRPVKNINLGIIYGQGVGSLAIKNQSTVQETKDIRDAIYNLYPGLKAMYADMRQRAKANEPIRTWGGREYYCEPPMQINGRLMTFDYKMVNVLVQGSAAECTKEAMIRFITARLEEEIRCKRQLQWYLLLQVHDEIVLSAPADEAQDAMEMLRQCMESVEFDVQILSEGAWSADNWASMRDYDVKGKLVDALP